MAEFDDAIAGLEELNKAGRISNEEFEAATSSFNKATSAIHNLTGGAGVLTRQFQKLIGELGNTSIEDKFELIQTILAKNSTEITKFGLKGALAIEPMIGLLNRNIDAFGRLGRASADAGVSISESFKAAQPALQQVAPFVAKVIGNVASTIEHAQNLDVSLLQTAAGAGEFSEVLNQTGDDLSKVDDVLANYSTRIEKAAEVTGKSSAAVANWAQMLREVPGALNTVIETGDRLKQTYRGLDATITIATGTGRKQEEVAKDLQFAHRQLGTRGREALEFVSRLGIVADEVKIPMDIMHKTVTTTAESFKMLGDNSQAAINIMGEFGTALKDSNIGPEAISDLVSGVTRGIKNLDVAHKAFISAQTGGRGGLAGAFDFDFLVQEGKLDEAFNKVKDAMANQFAGPIVTLEDQQRDANLSGELFKQVTFLKEVAGIADSNFEAFQILKTMKEGGPGGELLKPVTGKEDALEQALDRGDKIQAAQNNQMIQIQNKILKVNRDSSLMMQQFLRGAGGGPEARRSETRRIRAEENLVGGAFGTVATERERGHEVTFEDRERKMAENFNNMIKSISNSDLVEMGKGIVEMGKKSIEDIKDIKNSEEFKKFQKIQKGKEQIEASNRSDKKALLSIFESEKQKVLNKLRTEILTGRPKGEAVPSSAETARKLGIEPKHRIAPTGVGPTQPREALEPLPFIGGGAEVGGEREGITPEREPIDINLKIDMPEEVKRILNMKLENENNVKLFSGAD